MFEYWRTKEGEHIQVIDMETTHIENCIRAIESGKLNFETGGGTSCGDMWYEDGQEESEKWLEIFRNELKFRRIYNRTSS